MARMSEITILSETNSDELKNILIEMHVEQKKTIAEIRRTYKCSSEVLERVMNKLEIPIRKDIRLRTDKRPTREELLDLMAKYTINEIASILSVCTATIAMWKKTYMIDGPFKSNTALKGREPLLIKKKKMIVGEQVIVYGDFMVSGYSSTYSKSKKCGVIQFVGKRGFTIKFDSYCQYWTWIDLSMGKVTVFKREETCNE